MLRRVNLLDTLRGEAEKLLESEKPTVTELAAIVGAFVKRIEAAAQTGVEDVVGALKGDPDPVPDPASTVTPIAPDGAAPPQAPAPPPPLPSDQPAQAAGHPAVTGAGDPTTVVPPIAASPPPPAAPSSPTVTDTADELKAQIADLQARLEALNPVPTAPIVTTDPPA